MAHQIQHSPKKKEKSGGFLGCFGFSGKAKPPSAPAKKRRRWFCLSLCPKQKSAAKTVPLADATAAAPDDKVNRSKEIRVLKSDTKKTSSKSRQLLPAASAAAGGSPLLVSGEVVRYKASKTSKYDKTESIILEKSKSLDHLNYVEYPTNHKKVSKKNSSVGATDEKPQLSRTSSTGKSSKKKKSATTVAARGGADSGYNRETSNLQDNNIGSTRNQDFTYGMSILTMILMITLLWGKLCAILCTAAWFYFAPRIRTNQEPEIAPENSRTSNNIHFSSEESKRKVVLDGFLERNHRATIIL